MRSASNYRAACRHSKKLLIHFLSLVLIVSTVSAISVVSAPRANANAAVTSGLVLNLNGSLPGSSNGTSYNGSTWFDQSGNGRNATAVNSPTYNSSDGSFTFNGTNQYFNLGNILSFTSAFSLEVTFTPNSVAGFPSLVSRHNGGVAGNYYAGIANSKAAYFVESSPWGTFSSSNLSVGTKYTLTQVYESNKDLTPYLNGVQNGTTVNHPNTLSGGNIDLLVGAKLEGSVASSFFSGKIHSVRIYNRALSSSEVLQSYNSTTCSPTSQTSGGYTTLSFTSTTTCNWSVPAGVTSADVLVVGGGGAGGGGIGGGGGAGEFIETTRSGLTGGSSITISVGAGGTSNNNWGAGNAGGNSQFASVIAYGGGGGGTNENSLPVASGGPNLGSQGGGGFNNTALTVGTRSDGITGFRNNGGSGSFGGSGSATAGGGGGAGSAGGAGTGSPTQSGGAGGAGKSSSITGTSTFYAAGGGGGLNGAPDTPNGSVASSAGNPGTGGSGIGGSGGAKVNAANPGNYGNRGNGTGGTVNSNGSAGFANTGSGGGGASNWESGGAGGSGVVIVRYAIPTVVVTFNKNDGTGATATQTIFRNDATNLTANSFTRTGYTFAGWDAAADGSGTDYTNQQSVSITSNMTLFAKWAEVGCTKTETSSGGYTIEKITHNGSCVWTTPTGVTAIEVAVIAGGGGGGFGSNAGGGGAGEVLVTGSSAALVSASNTTITSTSTIATTAGTKTVVTVGAGGTSGAPNGNQDGAGAEASWRPGGDGGASSFGEITANGGGGGGGNTRVAGAQGGSGGGAASGGIGGSAGTNITPSNWKSFRNAGSNSAIGGFGGGGGAGGAGLLHDGMVDTRNGGLGVTLWGSKYAGGGGGWQKLGAENNANDSVLGGNGRLNIGGSYPYAGSPNYTSAGVANTGTGGGGGAPGGSGVVIVRYANGGAAGAAITTQPSGAVSRSALTTQPVIRIVDGNGTTVTSSTVNVVASIASGTGTLSGTTTVAAVNGIATFTNLVITGTGNHTLTFTPTSLAAATSSSFSVSETPITANALTSKVTAPVRAATPLTTAVDDTQFTGTVAWFESNGTTAAPSTFAANTVYVAKVTLTAKTGYTLTGLSGSFTYTGATSVSYSSGVVTITFAATDLAPRTISFATTAYNKAYLETQIVSATASLGSGTVTYSVGSSTACTVNGSTITISSGTGTCLVTASVASDGTYASATTTTPVTITVSKAVSTIGLSGGTYTYTGSGLGPDSATTSGSTGAVTYAYAGRGSTSYASSSNKPTAVGTYTVTATLAADANYASVATSAQNFEITNAGLVVTPTISASSMTYGTSGGSLPTISYTKNPDISLTTNPTCALYLASDTGFVTVQTLGSTLAAGSYVVRCAGAAATNYTISYGTNPSFTVTKLDITLTVGNPASTPYTGSSVSVTNTFTRTSGTLAGSDAISGMTYTYTSAGGYNSTTAPTAGGNYTITGSNATFSTGSASNYTITYVAGALTITTATQTVTWAPNTNLLTTDSPATPSALATALGSATISYAVTSAGTTGCTVNSSTAVLTFTAAGNCQVTATAAATSNYATASTAVTFAISIPTYVITLAAGTNGSGSNQTLTKTRGVDLTLPNSATANGYFTRTGYSVTGWSTTNLGSQTHALGGSFTTEAATTLYPVWTLVSCSPTSSVANGYTIYRFTTVGTCTWTVPNGLTNVEVLAVAGGGGGGYSYGNTGAGGGGGGQVKTGTATLGPTLEVTVGAGGTAGTLSAGRGGSGGNSIVSSITALGGTGGCGVASPSCSVASAATASAAANGGAADQPVTGFSWKRGRGGGGSSGVRGTETGGDGTASDYSGTSTSYGAGGSGGSKQDSSANIVGTTGTANTGNGGGGAATGTSSDSDSSLGANGGAGGSGVVVVRTGNTLNITYDANGGSAPSGGAATTITGGTISSLATTSRTGYTFSGWFTAASGGTQITTSAAHTRSANFTLYAQWSGNSLTVTYDSQGGSAVTSGSVNSGANISAAPTAPTRAGYTLSGWSTTSTGSVVTFPFAHNQTASFTLYAIWSANALTITYDSKGGTAVTSGTVNTAASISSAPTAPTRTGYSFSAWSATDGGTAISFPYAHGQTANFTLYALWIADTKTITYAAGTSGTGSAPTTPSTVSYGSTFITPANTYLRSGFKFAGWSDGSTTYAAGVTYPATGSITGNVTLTATWTALLSRSLTIDSNSYFSSYLQTATAPTITSTASVGAGTKSYESLTSSICTVNSSTGAVTFISTGNCGIRALIGADDTYVAATSATVYFAVSASQDGKLQSIRFSAGVISPQFVTTTYSYTVSVNSSTTSLTVTPTIFQSTSTATVNGTSVASGQASGSISLSLGRNTILVRGISQNGLTTQTYTITVNRGSTSFTIAQTNGRFLYANSVFGQTFTVPNGSSGTLASISDIFVSFRSSPNTGVVGARIYDGVAKTTLLATSSATCTDADSGIAPPETSADFNWVTCDPFTFTGVTLSAGTTYYFEVFRVSGSSTFFLRQSELNYYPDGIMYNGATPDPSYDMRFAVNYVDANASSDSTLSALAISSGSLSPSFATSTTSYSVSVANSVSSLTLTPTKNHSGASITVNGTSVTSGSPSGSISLSTGVNTLTVVVTAQDGTTTSSYTVQVTRAVASRIITYALGGGSGTAPTQANVLEGSTFTTAASTGLTRAGYTFDKWNDGTNDYAVSSTYTVGGANVTLTATWIANALTVSFNSKSGTAVANGTVNTAASISAAPTAPTRAGYTFSAWSASDGGTAITFPYAHGQTANFTLYAIWSANALTVTYNAKGGTTVSDGTVNTAASISAAPTAPTRTGYTLSGWSATDGGTVVTFPYAHGQTANFTLYAKWTAVTTNAITYNNQSATTAQVGGSTSYTTDAAIATIPTTAPLRVGYTFAGWFTDPSTGVQVTNGTYTPASPYGSITLYAQWSANALTVTYDSKGGTAVTSGTVNTAASISSAPTPPTRAGYTFSGWSATDGGTAITFPYAHGQTANFTLYALWTAGTLVVTYNSQGGSAVSNGTAATGASISSAPTAPTRTGYTFDGWSTTETGTVVTFPFAHGQTANFTLYARWSLRVYSVAFNANSGTGTMGNQSFTHGVTTSLNANLYSRANYVFHRWATAADGTGTTYNNFAQAALTTETILYAQWTPNTYVVTFNYNGGDGGDSNATASYTTAGTAITLPVPTKTGFTFAGWQSDAALTTAIGSGGGSGSYSPTGATLSLNAYAKWTAINYTFTYNSNSADSGTVPTETSKQITQTATVKANTGSLALAGYTFSGWNTASDGTGTTYLSGSLFTVGSSNVTLYAKWSANTYTITYNTNGGTGNAQRSSTNVSSDTYTTGGSSVVFPGIGTLERIGFTFGGWNTSAAGTGTNYSAANTYTAVSNVIFYAKWNPVTYTITYNGNTSNGGSAPTAGGYTTGQASPYVVLANTFTKTSNVFGGWNTAANGTGTSYSPNSSITTLANMVLYATWIPQFTLHYAINGGTVTSGSLPSDTLHNSGTSVGPIFGSVSRTGYTFAGWANGSATILGGSNFTILEDSVLTAKWNPINYTISYNSDGGTEAPATSTKQIGQSFTVEAAVSKPGYTFTGWFNGSTVVGADAVVVMGSANISYTAQWVARVYTVSYDWNGGRGTAEADVNYTFGTTAITLPLVGDRVKDGYTFAGWSESVSGSLLSATYIPSRSRTLYALWTLGNFTVTYNLSGGTLANAAVAVQNGSSTVLPLPTRANFVFDGWHTATAGGSSLGSHGTSFTPTASQTVYARWIQSSLYGITDSLTRIGSVVTVANVGNTFSGANSSSSVAVSVPENALPAGTTINFDMVGNSSRATGLLPNVTYLISIAISWIAGDGTVPDTASGKPISVTISNATIKTGATAYAIVNNVSTLLGTATQDGTITIDLTSDPEIVIAAVKPSAPLNVTATANGNQQSVISWSTPASNGGSEITNYTVTSNTNATCTTSTTSCTISGLANGTGYTFTVTAANSVGTSVASSSASATTAAVYSVAFNSRGGTSVSNGSFLTASSVNEPTAPTRSGYTFVGWSATDGGSVITFPYAPGVTSNITLFARWAALDNAVTFDSKGGSSVTNTVFASGGTLAAPVTPTRSGFTFAGWSATDGGSAISFPYAPGVVTPITLYAKWTPVVSIVVNTTTVIAPVTVTGAKEAKISTAGVFTPISASDLRPLGVKIDESSKKFIAEVKVIEGKLVLTPEVGFSGKKIVTVTINENGVDRVVQIPLTVLPENVTKPVLTPVVGSKSMIRWTASPNATTYTVLLNGKRVCTTNVVSCSVSRVLGPDAEIEVVANGGEGTVSQKVKADFKQTTPVLVARIVSATNTKGTLSDVDTKALEKTIELIKNQGFRTVVISNITTTKKTEGLANERIAKIKSYILAKTGNLKLTFTVVPASSRTYFNNISLK